MVSVKIVPNKPAILLENKDKTLVITDLHIGFEENLAEKEIFVGKNSSIDETIFEISELVESTKANSLILLGDVKSSIKSITKTEWNDVPIFFEKLQNKVELSLVPGNHDANIYKLLPENVNLISPSGLVIDNILLTHGHAMPSENFSHIDKIIMGHVHPVFFQEGSVLNGNQVWVSVRAEKQKIFPSAKGELEITIIPSFNKYFYATYKRKYKKSISPIIEKIKPVLSARIVTLDGNIIGNECDIDKVL